MNQMRKPNTSDQQAGTHAATELSGAEVVTHESVRESINEFAHDSTRDSTRESQPFAPPTANSSATASDATLAARLAQFDRSAQRRQYLEQGEFLFIEDFLPTSLQQMLIDGVSATRAQLNRNFIPGHKKGGSVSRHTIDREAPAIAALYRDPAFIAWLESLCGERLQLSPESDPHAYALYFYTEAGDHIGWHYDTSYYAGRRYTVLLGVIDRSSAKLAYRLHTRNPERVPVEGEVALAPGALVLFNGDTLHHRITPLGAGEERVALTFEYVTDPYMKPWHRLFSNLKDAFAYFGLRQVFRRGGARSPR